MSNLKRRIDRRKLQKPGSNNQAASRENKRLPRSTLPVLNGQDKCIFCQLYKKEKLHALGTDKKLGVAIVCDDEREQVNHEDKTCGGLKGITRNYSSCNRHYLVVPVLAQLHKGTIDTNLVHLMCIEKGCGYQNYLMF